MHLQATATATTRHWLPLLGLLLALGSSSSTLAQHWDTLGSKHQAGVQRYSLPGRGPGYGQLQRGRGTDWSPGQVNIIVAPPVPATAWAPRWDDRFDRRHGHRHHDPVFNSSLGFIAGTVVGLVAAPQLQPRGPWAHEYQAPRVVIDHSGHGRSISLLKDRYGACYERETDRHGRVIRRRVADYNCDF